MTRAEALAEARRRFGVRGRAWEPKPQSAVNPWFFVGTGYRAAHSIKGSGPSWEAAFADADRRAGVRP